jgi:response regulator RpfG family c-di-GMP phosphodiesterase
MGYRCTRAGSVAEAAQHLVAASYEVMVSDVRSPDGSGLDLVEQVIAEHPDLAHRRREISARDALREAGAETIRRLCATVEARDTNTAAHIIGMSDYCYAIACELGLPAERCDLLRAASPKHDVGKVALPDHILLKSGGLSPHERE